MLFRNLVVWVLALLSNRNQTTAEMFPGVNKNIVTIYSPSLQKFYQLKALSQPALAHF